MRLLIIFALLALKCLDVKPNDDSSLSLYNENSFVTELDASTFDDYVYCQKDLCGNAKFVQFYNSKSKLSQDFVPLFTEIAKSTTSWFEVVRLFTVNCALDSNKELCSKHGHKRIPLLKYFPVSTQKGNFGRPMTLYTNATIIIEDLMIMLEKEYSEKYHEHWPIFSQIPNDTYVEELWNAQLLDTTHILVMFVEKPYDFRTFNLLIQTKKADPDLIARIAVKGSLITHLLQVYEYPSYLMLRRNEKPRYNPYTDKWVYPSGHKRVSLEEEFAKVLGKLDFGLYERYSKRKSFEESDPDDYVFYRTQFKIYRPDVPTKHTKSPEKIVDDDYDGIEVQLKMEFAQPKVPGEELALNDVSNHGQPQMQVSNAGFSKYFCRFMELSLLTMLFNLIY